MSKPHGVADERFDEAGFEVPFAGAFEAEALSESEATFGAESESPFAEGADGNAEWFGEGSGASNLTAQQRAWILALDRTAIERLPDAAARAGFLQQDWSDVEFPGNVPKGQVATNQIKHHWALARSLFNAMAGVVPERRVPTTIRFRDRPVVKVPGQPTHRLFGEARDAFVRMREAARADGVDLVILSSWRSRARQAAASASQPNPAAVARKASAHMYGLAIDLRMGVPGLPVEEINTRVDRATAAKAGTAAKMGNLVRMYRSPVYKWMSLRAHEFGWYPYRNEPWHWEYNPPGLTARFEGATRGELEQEGRPEAEYEEESETSSPFLRTFTAKALGVKVAVYVTKAARSAPQVEMMLFAHGLDLCKPVFKDRPATFITERPFKLGELVEATGRPIVLVVPFLDWERLDANRMAFGRKWHRLAQAATFNQVAAEALEQARAITGSAAPAKVQRLILAGHSRAYGFFDALAHQHASPDMRTGALSQPTHVWALDTTYSAPIADWRAWLRSREDLHATVVFRHGKYRSKGSTVVHELATGVRGREFAKLATASNGRLTAIPVAAGKVGHCAIPATYLPRLLAALPAPTTSGEDESEALDESFEPSGFEAEGERLTYDEALAWLDVEALTGDAAAEAEEEAEAEEVETEAEAEAGWEAESDSEDESLGDLEAEPVAATPIPSEEGEGAIAADEGGHTTSARPTADDELSESPEGEEELDEEAERGPGFTLEAAFESQVAAIQPAWRMSIERGVLLAAIATEQRSAKELTNRVFFMRHPDRAGTRIARGETALAQEWNTIHESLVVPLLLSGPYIGPMHTRGGIPGSDLRKGVPADAVLSPLAISLRGLRAAKYRQPGTIAAVVVHNTSRGSANRSKASGYTVPAVDYAVKFYVAGREGFPHYVIDFNGTIYATCDERYVAHHAGWVHAGGKSLFRSDWQAPGWWSRIWYPQGARTPIDLLPKGASSPNHRTLAIELMILPDLSYTQEQYRALARLLVDMQHRNPDLKITSAPSRSLLGHEDFAPVTAKGGRANAGGGWDPGAHRDKPFFDWARVWSEMQGVPVAAGTAAGEARQAPPDLDAETEDAEGQAERDFIDEAELQEWRDTDEAEGPAYENEVTLPGPALRKGAAAGLLQFINLATLAGFKDRLAHRAAMGKIARLLLRGSSGGRARRASGVTIAREDSEDETDDPQFSEFVGLDPLRIVCAAVAAHQRRWETVRDEIVRVAKEEFQVTWNNGTLTETAQSMRPVIERYWRDGVFGGGTVTATIPTESWSAAFIAWVVHAAGGAERFSRVDDEATYRPNFRPRAHWRYLAPSKINRDSMSVTNPFWAFAIDEEIPKIGDIVIRSRSGSGATFDAFESRNTHGDIVVEVGQDTITVIGGNAGPQANTVARRTYPLTAQGFVDSTGGGNNDHFAIVRINSAIFDLPFCQQLESEVPERVNRSPGQHVGAGGR